MLVRTIKKLSVYLLFVLLVACNKEDDPEKFTSVNGFWVVRTPDNATTVTFRVGLNQDDQLIVERAAVSHNGSDYNTKPIDAEINAISTTEFESITILNNTHEIPFFVIRFITISLNSDFTEMQIANSTFNIDGVFREFPMITATRD